MYLYACTYICKAGPGVRRTGNEATAVLYQPALSLPLQETKDRNAELSVQLEMTKVELMGDTFHSRGNSLFGEVSVPLHLHAHILRWPQG